MSRCCRELLLLSIWWVKKTKGETANFVAEVALVFDTLKGALQEAMQTAPASGLGLLALPGYILVLPRRRLVPESSPVEQKEQFQ